MTEQAPDYGARTRRPAPPPDRLWTKADLAAFLAVSESTAAKVAQSKGFPRPISISQSKRWRPEEVLAWVDGQKAVPINGKSAYKEKEDRHADS
jgi:predicted DNA-binding transcriptional regulator AlpA